jgi:hypothetical protein
LKDYQRFFVKLVTHTTRGYNSCLFSWYFNTDTCIITILISQYHNFLFTVNVVLFYTFIIPLWF